MVPQQFTSKCLNSEPEVTNFLHENESVTASLHRKMISAWRHWFPSDILANPTLADLYPPGSGSLATLLPTNVSHTKVCHLMQRSEKNLRRSFARHASTLNSKRQDP